MDRRDIMMFAKRLKELRTKHNLSQTQLAELLNIPRGTIAQYESDKTQQMPRRPRLEQIATFFSVNIDYLLGRTDDRSSPASAAGCIR